MRHIFYLNKVFLYSFFGVTLLSCSKLIEVEPPITNINGENVFRDEGSAVAALTGIYNNMSNANVNTATGWLTNIFFLTGLMGDELTIWDPNHHEFGQYYQNNISPVSTSWSNQYKIIFIANSAIEELPKSEKVSEAVRNQLLGEAKFVRAFSYFYLVNMYGRIPLTLSTDYKVSQLLARTSEDSVYKQIVADLKEAQQLMTDNFVDKNVVSISSERVRPNKWTATALLARVYLYLKDFEQAEEEATRIINNTSLFQLVDLGRVFRMNNSEAIWQLQPVGNADNF